MSAQVGAGIGPGLVEDRHDPAQVGAGRDLGHDPAGRRVQRDLGGDHVGVDPPAVLDERDAGLVARRLDGEDQAAAHVAATHGSPPRIRPRGRRRRVERGAQAGDPLAHRRLRQRLGRHDQRVLAVVAVVARAQADRPEAELLVQPAGRQVREPDLERRLVGAAVDGEVEEREQQPLADALAAPVGVDGEGGDVAPRRPSATSRRSATISSPTRATRYCASRFVSSSLR